MAIFDELKSVGKILQEAGKIEQYQQVLEAQQELLEMQKKTQKLEEENTKLRAKFKIKNRLIPEKNTYWLKKENNFRDGPFCTSCWDAEFKLIRLHKDTDNQELRCPKCKTIAVRGEVQMFIPNYDNPAR